MTEEYKQGWKAGLANGRGEGFQEGYAEGMADTKRYFKKWAVALLILSSVVVLGVLGW